MPQQECAPPSQHYVTVNGYSYDCPTPEYLEELLQYFARVNAHLDHPPVINGLLTAPGASS